MKRNNWINFCDKMHKPLGASETIPNLTLPVHELMERLTDHTLDDIRAKSILHGDYFPVDPKADPLDYADKMCLGETCIDFTDYNAVRSEVSRQIGIMQEKMNKDVTKNNLLSNAVVSESQVQQTVKVE